MKLSAFILSFLFIVLSIQPVFINWGNMACLNKAVACGGAPKTSCCKIACSSAKNMPAKKPIKQAPENPCDNCNPFMSCNGCHYVHEESQALAVPMMLLNAENKNALNNTDLSDFNAESWHPPELFYHL